MCKTLLTVLLVLAYFICSAQEHTKSLSGRVVDDASQEGLPFANVTIINAGTLIGTTTDHDGYYYIDNLPPGRYDIEVSYLGFESYIALETVIKSNRVTTLDVSLSQVPSALDEIVIRPKVSKQKPLNSMASVSARMLSVEEARRYAGGFDDPARLASSFPGVASSVGNNAIIIRGNSPKYLQWKIEGIEISNPNHFADLAAFGGGGLTALSSNMMANSDFYTGAFPAEYNNALSGVFDMNMRSGDHQDFHHSIELGAIGVDLTSEGPISRKSKSSYLVNYRYSTLGLVSSLLPEDAQGTNYQDLAFKLKFPSKKAGTLTLWSIGLLDNSGAKPETDLASQVYYQDIEEQDVTQYMGAAGINHKIMLSDSRFLNTSLSLGANGMDLTTNRLNEAQNLMPENRIKYNFGKLTLKSFISSKYSDRHSNKTGITLSRLGYDINLGASQTSEIGLTNIVDNQGGAFLLAANSASNFNFGNWQLKAGVNTQIFTLSSSFSIEPRIGLTWSLDSNNQISFGYGLHSRLEPMSIYLAKTDPPLGTLGNKDLGFTKAHHLVLGYDLNITTKMHLKVEPYFQYLFNVPIKQGTNESLINLQNDWFVDDVFQNGGVGRNYGIDLTLEQYMHKGFYYLLSGSLFKSQYQAETEAWYSTRYDKGYLLNVLVGKEYRIGKNNSMLGINLKMSVQGGDRHSRIDALASATESDVVFDESVPFELQTRPATVFHFTANYEWYRKKTTHAISIKILNATNYEEFLGFKYNLKSQSVEEDREALLIPNVSYRIEF